MTAPFTALFPFCGLGAGAMGFLRARADILGREASFRSLGGIDCDALACVDFRSLTGSPALEADIATLTPAQLRTFCPESPDVVFSSPPCKGFSGLLSEKKSRAAKYEALNKLVLQWTELMLATWERRPRLVLIENVPRIATRGKHLLAAVKRLLKAAGYVFHASAHDCGELGGLAQHRRRFLLVARHAASVPALLYQPPAKRVRGCGEVLGELPLPGDPAAGPLHRLPRISLLNWVRLALIPPGGDWRDLPAKMAACRAGAHNNKYVVLGWDEAARTVIGATRPGSGAPAVADPRFNNVLAVRAWNAPTGAVTSGSGPTSGNQSVADPRVVAAKGHPHTYGVLAWDAPAHTVTGGMSPGTAPCSVADPRLRSFGGGPYGVSSWDAPAGTVTGNSYVTTGRFAVGDPRIASRAGYHHGTFGVGAWHDPSGTVTGGASIFTGTFAIGDPRLGPAPGVVWHKGKHGLLSWWNPSRTVIGGPSNGADAVGDPRLTCHPRETSGAYGVLPWDRAAWTVTGSLQIDTGWAAVADPRVPGNPALRLAWCPRDVRSAPPFAPVFSTADGTWHRPLTTLELAALQGLPTVIDGRPLALAGKSATGWRERIGNAVPVPTAEAIARQMLLTLAHAAAGTWTLSGDGEVWVEPPSAEVSQ